MAAFLRSRLTTVGAAIGAQHLFSPELTALFAATPSVVQAEPGTAADLAVLVAERAQR